MAYSKYGNVKVKTQYGTFDSKREYKRYLELLLLEKAGEIHQLKRQMTYNLVVKNVKVCKYVADFTYLENGKNIVEDSKGVKTAIYRLKKKLMKAVYGIDILET